MPHLLDGSKKYDQHVLVGMCTQIAEALRYLHDEVRVLHNDLKCNNVIVCDSLTDSLDASTSQNSYDLQNVVVDFGKATTVENGKKYQLTPVEKSEYSHRYGHIAPEVIEGITAQTIRSDVYAFGGILQKVQDYGTLHRQVKKRIDDISTRCRSPNHFSRPVASNTSNKKHFLKNGKKCRDVIV